MTTNTDLFKDRKFLAIIGDENTVSGMLLAGIGQVDVINERTEKNFFIVDAKVDNPMIEAAFDNFTVERKDIGILLINQHVAERIRYKLDDFKSPFPTVLEIPSKDKPYDPEKDTILKRVKLLTGDE
ncbi:vacuolar ATP synthase [Zalerion maritima]|uniref:V-type proton ATPase subunit F n=1 Tax=Zalerion maritima TaxID=339359 RepID=A0AAD5WPJ8_9PEZI|nr:vacuolar ATP synthase [Zalerion maritima]